jgi:hypothetical protein
VGEVKSRAEEITLFGALRCDARCLFGEMERKAGREGMVVSDRER